MEVRVHTRCLELCLPSVPHSPSSPQAVVSSPSKLRGDGVIVCKYVHGANVGFRRRKPYRTGSLEHYSRGRGSRPRSSCSTSSDFFLDDESSGRIHDMTAKFEFSDGFSSKNNGVGGGIVESLKPFECFEPGDWPEREEVNLACVERRFNSLEIPISLRMIQRKKQWKEGVIKEIKESACTSVKKAFSSMVFIIQELHSCTLQMRELLFYEDLQGILSRAQNEIQASFVWLFQQVFSQTPTLMVSVMILLANYSVHSMANNAAIAYTMLPPQASYAAATTTTESVSVLDDQKFDLSEITPFSASKTTSIGGGGGKSRPVASSSTDGEGRYDRVSSYSIIQNPSITNEEEESVSEELTIEEMRLWKSVKEEAAKMQALDRETRKKLLSPVHVMIEADDYYGQTESLYQMGLSQDPNNPLLLTNYAQFLFLVIHDHDRAEYYFKRAVKVEPRDAEALDKYANFLWLVKKDIWSAEQAHLEAMDTDPSNSYYIANYANFLWNTGGEGTCLAN